METLRTGLPWGLLAVALVAAFMWLVNRWPGKVDKFTLILLLVLFAVVTLALFAYLAGGIVCGGECAAPEIRIVPGKWS